MIATKAVDSGVKKITISSWQEPDEAPVVWRQITSSAKMKEDWLKLFLRPELNSNVPSELAKLLEVARPAMIYSWYFIHWRLWGWNNATASLTPLRAFGVNRQRFPRSQ
jgi:hypothetical protein